MARKKDKDAGAEAAAAPERPVLSLGDHARAQAGIARAKAIGGLAGLVLGFLLSWRAGVPVADALGRGLTLGIALWIVAWAGAVLVWRQIAAAEIEVARRRLLATLDEAEAKATARRTQASA